ncbi:unnamed protein product [Haemonchus placei]|uniref:Secreted protein n=1 Tax=Haemonchus placei TaxID=6290 RepID=A0A0N4WB80_HAEPC|nr:unnamed protein product [Haemonchus placei]
MFWYAVITAVVLLGYGTTNALKVALFPSTGCYSHDVMMREVGEALGPTANVTWIQTFIFDFGFGEIDLPSKWTRISLWGHDNESKSGLLSKAMRLLWYQFPLQVFLNESHPYNPSISTRFGVGPNPPGLLSLVGRVAGCEIPSG